MGRAVRQFLLSFSDEACHRGHQNAAERFSALRNDQQRQQRLLANAERVSQEPLPVMPRIMLAETDTQVPVLFRLDAVLDDARR